MSSYACIPICKKCREAGSCATQAEIDYKIAHRRPPRWPDLLAFTRMACGCRADLIPLCLGRVGATHIMCSTHGWQPLTKREAELDKKQENDQGVIPF